MQKLNDLEIEGLIFDIIDAAKDEYNDFYLTVRITNLSNKSVHICLEKSRYISIKKGILKLKSIEPSELNYTSEGCDIIPNSFLDAKIEYEINTVFDGDRFDLRVNDMFDLLAIRNNGEWYVMEYDSKSNFEKRLNNIIEHFDAIEEKIGISIQNISVKIVEDDELKLFCEVLSINGEPLEYSFAIEVGVYDNDNKIIGFTSIHKDKDDFLGFEVFSFNTLSLDLSEIGKIRVYPTKI